MSDSTFPWAVLLADYQTWLAKQPLAQNTRRTYLVQVRQYGAYLGVVEVSSNGYLLGS
jgi:hypothetical protein